MPFNVSEEQSLLASMISERDAQISSLTHQLHSTGELLQSTQRELQHKSASRRAQREEHSATIKKLKEEHSEQRRVLAKFEQNVKSGGGLRVHEYAALMRSANSNQVESTYVVRLQAQLCRAMHSLGVMESQLALVKENCSSLIKFMKEDLSHMVDDRTRREIELMNGLARADGEKRVMAQEMAQKVREREELLDQVREEYEELGLEYDENEVKQALEVKYLLEQMAKVQEDKVRLEKELLAALLEREEQIEKLRGETEGMGEKLEGLKKEVEERDRQYAVSGTGEDADAGEAEESEEGAEATADGEAEGEEDTSEEGTPDTDGGDAEEEPAAEEEVAAVAAQLENAAIKGEEDAPSDSAATDDASPAEEPQYAKEEEEKEGGQAAAAEEGGGLTDTTGDANEAMAEAGEDEAPATATDEEQEQEERTGSDEPAEVVEEVEDVTAKTEEDEPAADSSDATEDKE